MDLTGPIHDFLLVFLGLGLILGGLGVVLLTNPIFSAFSLGLVLVCISLFHIPSNSHFVATQNITMISVFDCWGWGNFTLVCTSIFVSLITTIPDTSWCGVIWTTRSNQILEQDLINKVSLIGAISMARQ
ncbi:hypothetical protein MKW92_011309 [Papaver armeniacum]|nr:hypothetical protein MKW92_011309 [Papaver armeniacum]